MNNNVKELEKDKEGRYRDVKKMNENIEVIEYFNSIICQMYSKMMYKIIDKEIVICKGSTIMGNYSLIKYGNMNNSEEVKDKMNEKE